MTPQTTHLLLIRADASSRVGVGHVMRCVALAQAWQAAMPQALGKVVFISSGLPEILQERLKAERFDLVRIEAVAGSTNDSRQTLDVATRLTTARAPAPHAAWLVLDGYAFVPQYQRAARDTGLNLLVVDDNAHHPLYECDILLNQNLHADALDYHLGQGVDTLLGPKYVLLRREFQRSEKFPKNYSTAKKNLLVTLGGGDPDNVTGKVLESLRQIALKGLHVKVVVGPANPHLAQLRDAARTLNAECEILSSVQDMPKLLFWADAAITAGGSTIWELCRCRVPMAILVTADNQQQCVDRMVAEHLALGGTEATTIGLDELAALLRRLLTENHELMIERQAALVDGRGADRVVQAMLDHAA